LLAPTETTVSLRALYSWYTDGEEGSMVADITRVTRRPHPDGVEACIRDTNINVWGLVEWRRLGRSDAEILRSIPGLTPEDLAAAWEYYDKHPDEIEGFIRRNSEA
jgi:uncharacterized protein (DUF433 family)